MLRTLRYMPRSRDWQMIAVAGALGFAATLAIMAAIDVYAVPLTKLPIALAAGLGSLLAVGVVGSISSWRLRRKLGERNSQLDGAINNIGQGLCMFDAQNRLLVWNECYQTMYNIDPARIWRGCTIRDLLDARIAAGTFPLDPARYDADLRAALAQGEPFPMEIEIHDGRIIRVTNQPIKGGGWTATHEDVTQYKLAKRELEQTRTFLDKIIEHVPSPIIVKGAQDLR